MPKSVVSGGARYFELMVFAHWRTTFSSSLEQTSTSSRFPTSEAVASRCHASSGNLASIGSQTVADQPERFSEAGFEGGLEFFIHSGAHFFQAAVDGFADAVEVGALGADRPVDTAGDFFAEGAAVFRLALREPGEVFAKPGFG